MFDLLHAIIYLFTLKKILLALFYLTQAVNSERKIACKKIVAHKKLASYKSQPWRFSVVGVVSR